MKPYITLITLGVDDLERSLRFYRDGLGLPTAGIIGQEFEHGAAVFIDLQGGTKLALFARENLAREAGLPVAPPSATEMMLAHNVETREEVDAVMATAAQAGAAVIKPAHDTFWGGYAGTFQDPDGHLWEVALNPQWSEAGGWQ